ncbi:family 10 glycosylhydrolase [Plectonema radiosum NIES-515]|uniref:Family 10 glycosylhydrolase n=1 Tax=Plectonema radiosum NIES-515 TaxID=2986073 RepID=A0ABT3AW48_9CYAN|nr:family 10 glycosylhydrolase [Plectonema radiosum]MCV3213346.1 family 10 glycosylhydrolase [Plectonema radiosum NIES-515]
MSPKKASGCGCSSVPISLIIVILGGGYWWLIHLGNLKNIIKLLPNIQQAATPQMTPAPSKPEKEAKLPQTETVPTSIPTPSPQPSLSPLTPQKLPLLQTPWDKKAIRGIYLSRYQITNNADEQTIRERVRYYHAQGINTIIHGVWGNGCTMYNSVVMQQTLGYKSCPNQFQERWLDWLIDEAHKHRMQVHAYFEKGIKIDKNSPIFDLAISKKWIVPGVDKTYAGIDQYVLDVESPEVANFFQKILVEFVQKYPTIDAVQWDDYLGYYAELPGKVDRTAHLTNFVQQMIADMKNANPKVRFDLCHHNPYWAKRYFAADWLSWKVDRVFIQAYNDANFKQELNYAENYAGVAITDNQLHHLKELVNNTKIKSILVFPLTGKPEETAATIKKITNKN